MGHDQKEKAFSQHTSITIATLRRYFHLPKGKRGKVTKFQEYIFPGPYSMFAISILAPMNPPKDTA
jgi:hypothetical protein